MSANASTIEKPSALPPVDLWAGEIVAAEEALKKFHERARVVTRKYLDERELLTRSSRWFNIFRANVEIIESALYAQLPKPSVSRKFTDYNDEVGRVAALIIERAITQDLDSPADTFDATMRHCVQDRLVPGLATAWLRLETTTEAAASIAPTPGNDADYASPLLQIAQQKVCVDYIFWSDFLWSPCRVWEERRWVARKAYMDRESLVARFGEELGNAVPLNYSPTGAGQNTQPSTPVEDVLKKACVYEIWDRTTRKVIWYTRGMPRVLDEQDDPLGLEGFEPCPKPMLANVSTSNTVPRPDYYMLQDQYMELDTINNRISMLVRACKVVGTYDKSAIGISRMLTEGTDNTLIPVDNWAMFAEKGGIKGAIDWLPLEMITTALRELNQAREVIKGQIYELTGIADIVRGASKASETLGAQQIKAQFASIRIKKLQDEVARFAGEIMRIKAEIMVKHFDPQILLVKSNIAATGNDQWVEPALALLKSAEGFEWRIQITSDTLAQADYAAEKQDRLDFMTSVTGFMAQVGPMLQASPESAPVLVGLLKWTVAGFRGARDIEGMLDQALDGLLKQQKEPAAESAPTDGQLKVQGQMQLAQQSAQLDAQARQQDMQLDQQRAQMDMQFEQQKQQLELMAQQQALALEQQGQQMALMFEKLMGQIKLQNAVDMADAKLEAQNAVQAAKTRE